MKKNEECVKKYWNDQHITFWVCKYKKYESLFYKYNNFNHFINSWNVSNVKDMNNMFFKCENFNQPLNNWNVSNVKDMNKCLIAVKNLINH